MNRGGVGGAATGRRPDVGCAAPGRSRQFIKRDDERSGRDYIGPAYSHTPAGTSPSGIRRERQAASALRYDVSDCWIAKSDRGPSRARRRVVGSPWRYWPTTHRRGLMRLSSALIPWDFTM